MANKSITSSLDKEGATILDKRVPPSLADKFKKIYIDELNIYYDDKQLNHNKDLPIVTQVKSLLKVSERSLLDIWIIQNYGLEEDTNTVEAVKRWELSLTENSHGSLFATHLYQRYFENEIIFYKKGAFSNELVQLCKTNDVDYITRIGKYFGYGLKDSFFLRASNQVVKQELIKALENNIIPSADKIALFSNDPTEPCLCYFDLENLPDEPTPAWDSFLYGFKKIEYRELFLAWVYSIFYAPNRGRQLLWIYGMGMSGKSTVIKALFYYLKGRNQQLAQTIEKRLFEDKYTMATFENCRLAIIPDNSDRWIINRDLIKNLTGADAASVRKMNKEKISVELYAKIMIASNRQPCVLIDVEHQISRIVYVALDDERIFAARDAWKAEIDGQWDKKISQEIPAIIRKAKSCYEKWIDNDGHNFKRAPEMLLDLKEAAPDIKETVDVYWDIHWEYDETAGYTPTNWIADDIMRFLNGVGANKIRTVRSYLYSKLRKLKNTIDAVGLGNTQVIKHWRYLDDKKTTLDQVISDRIAEMNIELFKNKK